MPDSTLQVEFSLSGLAQVLKGFKQVQDAATKTGKATGSMGGDWHGWRGRVNRAS